MNVRPCQIAIVAPSGYPADPEALPRAIARLSSQGHQVHDYTAGTARHQRFAATDAARLAQLHDAARNPEVELVIALRGGYGLSRLLPQIDFPLLAASGKRFIGHSDFTALQLGLLATTGQMSFAGPMICDDFSRETPSTFTLSHFWSCVTQPSLSLEIPVAGNPSVQAEGLLWGGNLSMVAHLLGTPWMPQIEGGLLFIEDISEHPYRIERMLLQLLHAGVLGRQRALILGDFSGYRLGDNDHGYDFEAMLAYLRERLPLPIVHGLPFGHVPDKLTLPVGAPARLHADSTGFTLTAEAYPPR